MCQHHDAIVGREVWRRRKWRAYLWPGLLFGLGVLMWPVMVFFTNSTVHMLAHSAWAQVMMLGGAAELGLVSGPHRYQVNNVFPESDAYAQGIREGTSEVEAAARDQVRAVVGVGVPAGGAAGGVPVGVAGVPVGVPVGGVSLAGAGGVPGVTITFQVTVINQGGELRGPNGEKPEDPLFWQRWMRAIRVAWFQQFGMTPEGRALG